MIYKLIESKDGEYLLDGKRYKVQETIDVELEGTKYNPIEVAGRIKGETGKYYKINNKVYYCIAPRKNAVKRLDLYTENFYLAIM